ncbi:hypothetical protein D3C87_1131910 [compost metagenome]
MTPQHNGVLTRHQRMVAHVISGRVSNITRGIDIVQPDDFQMRINMQTSQMIALGGDLLGQ